MSNKTKPKYHSPTAKDLSSLTASGGMCIDGNALTSQFCQNGPTPVGGDCSPNGISPLYGYCNLGNVAVEGCNSGSIHI